MGLPGLLIPESLVGDLSTILASTGATVTTEPYPLLSRKQGANIDKSSLPTHGLAFLCAFEEGVTIRVACFEEAKFGTDRRVALIEIMNPSLLRLRVSNRFVDEIVEVLRKHGGVDPVGRQDMS